VDGWSVVQLTTAEVGWMPLVNTPEMTVGDAVTAARYSYAPESVLEPCGREFPAKSVGTAERFMPASIPAPPLCSWKSYGAVEAFTNMGFDPTWLVPIVHPVESDMTPDAPYTRLWSIEQELIDEV